MNGHANYLLQPDENGDGLGETRVYHFASRGSFFNACSEYGLPDLDCEFKVNYVVTGGVVRVERMDLDCEPPSAA